jgi:DNA-binding response OmpR family regulator
MSVWLEPAQQSRKTHFVLAGAKQSFHIMVGHRDAHQRSLLARTLTGDGYRVRAARDGDTLLEWMADDMLDEDPHQPQLIIVEIDLPGRRGIDLLADLRAVGWDTPFVLIAARRSRLIDEARRFTRTIVFEEPYELFDLRTAVSVLVGQRGRGAAWRASARSVFEHQ